MKDCSSGVTPIVNDTTFELSQDQKNNLEWEHVKKIPYASHIENLM